MATAPTPLRTTTGNLCLGSAPDSWGAWFPEADQQVPYIRFLDELAAAGADRLGRLLLDDYDVRLVIHPHADSHIQTQPEIERPLNESDSRCTNLCLDTGHVTYGGGDNVDLIRRFGERVGYVHIKQMNPEILAQVDAEDLSSGEAVRRGGCASPPAGVPEPADVIAELARLDAELFVIVEQGLYPCAPEVPLPIAVHTSEHLAGCGLTGTRRPVLKTLDRR
ncbi:MAG: TIM barrel protein [Streptomyces sp.]|nr:TIM barrel protein [Streptomyces sp.]NUT29741.1 TIM barrel protein [Streptomyces sp.]